jgi:hypothetical protein
MVVFLVVLALLLTAGVVADFGARSFAENVVRDQIIQALALPPGSEPSVDLGPGSLLAQAFTGRIDSVTVAAEGAKLGDFISDVQLVATGVPLDFSQPVTRVLLELAVADSDLAPFATMLGDAPIESLSLTGSNIVVTASMSLYGIATPVVVSLAPSALDGQLVFTPVAITVSGADLSLEAATQWPYSLILAPLVQPRPLCLAQYLPRAMVLTQATISDGSLRLTFVADDVVAADGGLTTLGTCP